MTKIDRKIMALADKCNVKENWGLPFTGAFTVLLVAAAFYLSVNFSIIANTIAVYAFYALFIGIVLQLICSAKYKKTKATEVTQ